MHIGDVELKLRILVLTSYMEVNGCPLQHFTAQRALVQVLGKTGRLNGHCVFF